MNFPWPVILASGSPRRKILLAEIIPEFVVVVPDVDESLRTGENLAQSAARIANLKAQAISRTHPDCLIVAADTLVGFLEHERTVILGKPAGPEEAQTMLESLSGRTHQVVTGVAIIAGAKRISLAEVTEVRFRKLSKPEIEAYVATGEPFDKAGSYAIQGGAKGFVEEISGSLSNVVGLPLERLSAELLSFVVAQGDARSPTP